MCKFITLKEFYVEDIIFIKWRSPDKKGLKMPSVMIQWRRCHELSNGIFPQIKMHLPPIKYIMHEELKACGRKILIFCFDEVLPFHQHWWQHYSLGLRGPEELHPIWRTLNIFPPLKQQLIHIVVGYHIILSVLFIETVKRGNCESYAVKEWRSPPRLMTEI